MEFNYNPVREGYSVASQLNELAHELMAKGVTALSYHITPPFYSQVSKRTSVFHFGYPEDIVSTYLDPEILESDPIPDHVMAVGHVMTWQQAVANQKLTEKHREFVRKAMDLGFIDGVAVPLFGPNSRNSHFSMNFGRYISPDDEEIVRPLVGIAQSYHRRICAIINQSDDNEPPLSERESQVLYWISRGKSNSDMAVILDISRATVDSYIRRLFKKLQVNDRISAVIVGLSNSLIKLM
ncbi:helix-turn-helix transcriptional regulator [Sphingorhabdus sp. M41]|uniref:helix-turn-helix transcriptional regulator n=1 Tax=Sphingorhabdus sp. M41 TaxID=1806885 RepID=UPI0018D48651|nr:LuxR C-terminal-related transcriptional regulator [Sphingorhabdus sp. M41]